MAVVSAFQILIIIRVLLFTESLLAVLNIISLIQVKLIVSAHAKSIHLSLKLHQMLEDLSIKKAS